jgi:hypothetical protein
MASLTPGQPRAKYPPGDREEHDRGYAAAPGHAGAGDSAAGGWG